MKPRTNRIFLTGIVISLGLHIAAVAVLSLRASGKQVEFAPAELMAVEFVQAAPPVEVQKPKVNTRPPEMTPEQRKVYAAEVRRVAQNAQPRSASGRQSRPSGVSGYTPGDRSSAGSAAGVAGQHKSGGGGLDLGTPSSGGTISVGGGGATGLGSVAGSGTGTGSGTGPGAGNNAPIGHGTSVQPPAVPPPAPPKATQRVRVKVCSASGLTPGKHCTSTTQRTFDEGRQPTRTCTQCKPPDPPRNPDPPAHNNIQHQVVEAKLLSGPKPSIPSSVRHVDASVSCQFTVRTDGSVSSITITSGSGIAALDQEVTETLRRWKYSPAKQGGVPREVRRKATFVFKR